MTMIQLAASLVSVIYGGIACLRHRQPLFFKILLYGLISYFFGALFTACYTAVHGVIPAGFHVGYFGHIGAYFFLFSSYYGAIDRLADGWEAKYRIIRVASAVPAIVPAALLVRGIAKYGLSTMLPLLMLILPVTFTLYYAVKHLVFPDVEMGIIRVMRPYNGCVILFSSAELVGQFHFLPGSVRTASAVLSCLFLVLLLPLAERGVRKWFI